MVKPKSNDSENPNGQYKGLLCATSHYHNQDHEYDSKHRLALKPFLLQDDFILGYKSVAFIYQLEMGLFPGLFSMQLHNLIPAQ